MEQIRIRVTLLAGLCLFAIGSLLSLTGILSSGSGLIPHTASVISRVPDDFAYTFNARGTLEEAPDAEESPSPFWFLDSGGRLLIKDGVGETIHGDVQVTDPWHQAYAVSNPADTDGGARPQNLFRLVTRARWDNAIESVSLRIDADNLSASDSRNGSNGLFLMSRYQDEDTLYYAGIRTDGTAVIKKKYRGTYHTMAQSVLFPGTYDRHATPNLLPHGQWLTLSMTTITEPDGSVYITLLYSPDNAPPRVAVSAKDDGRYGNTPPILTPGAVGIRTDFMDVSLKDFKITGTPE
jgi:hypothetical protein